ncbi:Transcriptional activator protein NhaR [Anatilimnocola aggregata]|uniref:Transcriptional activator protein NhaR n=1 Tax=Anatilimnocola aggregata TaxID=2528021 RepID=A0A517YL06_9BACT|nr:LysR family transcriptional regulator [Anatilimnocola aggregata]QDU30917.1 Transcriptional activator protein NhaR [Anatilimnocola aggregata]
MMEKLQDLNFLHLFYFWMVVRHGSITAACERLHLTQPTISTQIRKLEKSLGHELFSRTGRELELTEVGQSVFEYAEDMFAVGRELLGALRGVPSKRALRLHVGVPMVMPKWITYRLLEPILHFPQPLQILCHEAPLDILIADLMRHKYDVILSDTPVPSSKRVRSYSHLLGSCGVTLCASRELASRLQRRFPQSMDGAPMLLPAANTELRRLIDRWLDDTGLSPRVIAEINDSALLQVFGQGGAGVFPIPTAVLPEVKRQFDVEEVGQLNDLQLNFYAITLQRKLTHPAVVAISAAAKDDLLTFTTA